jgi:hypothetical protein
LTDVMDAALFNRTLLQSYTQNIESFIGDGTAFFDTMDAMLSSDYWYGVQLDRYAFRQIQRSCDRIVVSGKWGFGFVNFVERYFPWIVTPLWVPGNLRHEELPPFQPNRVGIVNTEFTFLDNSSYKGRTRDQIKKRIEEAGGTFAQELVIYDGSREPIPGIKGLYRYHS